MVTYRAFDEIIDFIASIPQPAQVLAYKPSNSSVERLASLLLKKQQNTLTEDESHELEQFMMIEHLMRMAKKKAKAKLRL